MKKNANDERHDEAEEHRWSAEDECTQFNAEAEEEALAEFEKGDTAEYFRENANHIIGLVIKRLDAVREGNPMRPIRPYDAETLARLMTADTLASYEARGFDENMSDEDTIAAWEDGDLVQDGYMSSAWTSATTSQRRLRDAVLEYATLAAAYAKHIKSASLLEWAEMIDILEEDMSHFYSHPPSQEDALRLIELEKSAATRLRLDKIIAKLPSYMSLKKAKKAK